MLLMIAIFLMRSTVPVVSMVPADTAGSREQDDDAYQTKNQFHIFFCFVISCERLSSGVIDSV